MDLVYKDVTTIGPHELIMSEEVLEYNVRNWQVTWSSSNSCFASIGDHC